MSCIDHDEMVQLLEGTIERSRGQEIEAHLHDCESCSALRRELSGMVARIAAQPGEEQGIPELREDVLALVRMGRTQTRQRRAPLFSWPRFAVAAPIGAAALAAAVVLLIVRPQDEPSADRAFQARSVVESADQWVDVQLFRVSASRDDENLPLGDVIRTDDRVAVAITNQTRAKLSYLSLFAVDHQGQIFWYYPAFTDPKTDPSSVKVCTDCRDQLLADEVRHALVPGALRFVALFSASPFTVSELERLIARDLARAGDIQTLERLRLEGVAQRSLLLQVVEPTGR